MILFIALVPLWLFGVIFPPTLDPTNRELLQFATLAWLPIVGTFLGWGRFLVGPLFRERSVILWLTAASLLALSASALLSDDPLHSLGYVLTVALGLVCCAGIWEIVGTRVVTCLSVYTILGTLMAIYTYFIGERVQGRLSIGDAHPNYLGLVSFGFLVSALAIPNRVLAGCLIAINFFIIIDTQSRSALGAGLLALLVLAALKARQIPRRRAAFALVGLALVSGLLVLIYSDVVAYWISSLFFLNDKYRGLGTGFTGRVEAWQEALDMFFNNPAFGVGFRMHERYMNTLSSAHNGYLSLLAEVGLIGVVPLISLTLLVGWRLLRRALTGDYVSMIGLSFVVGYAFLVVFERLFLNMGNPTSILAWLFLMAPDRLQVRSSNGYLRIRGEGIAVLTKTPAGTPTLW